MTVNSSSRSQNESLVLGATDGTYRQVRPNTQVVDDRGDELTRASRKDLHPWLGYGYLLSEVHPMDRAMPTG